jgi:hypothetical protein
MTTLTRKVGSARRRAGLAWQTHVPPRLRGVGTPFAPGHEVPLLLHCTHHKSGTVWFANVLHAVAVRYGMSFAQTESATLPADARVVLHMNSGIDLDALPALRGSHMIRDPRDVVVSGYHYHRWSYEPWLHVPRDDLDGQSYQQHLNALSLHDGLLAEIRESAPVIRQMTDWNYDDPRFLELRYEDAILEGDLTFRRVFEHYGFHPRAVDRAIRLAQSFSFERVTRRRVGQVAGRSHYRSGRSGQWRDVFTDEHIALFDQVTDRAAHRLGYADVTA